MGMASIPGYRDSYDVVPLSNEHALVFWSRDKPFRDTVYRAYSDGKLGPIEIAGEKSSNPRVAATADGAVHLIYQESDPYAFMNQYERPRNRHDAHIYYRRLKNGVWSESQEIASNVFLNSASIEADESDRVHLFWVKYEKGMAQLMHATAVQSSK
jgi:hypothetical protein